MGLTSCGSDSKQEDPQPVVSATPSELSMARTMTYPAASSRNNGLSYTQQTLSGAAVLEEKRFYLNFVAPEGVDRVNFEVPRTALSPGLTGTYPVLSRSNSGGVVPALYVYYRVNVATSLSGSLYYSAQNQAQGQLTITAYDATRKLISGTYEMQLTNIHDPLEGPLPSSTALRCDVNLTGSFKDLKVE
ncbi:hypothetical protein MUN84_08970 [Hymenobacter sp. 5516J-16]|uniref:hypothetical protein n=1 Tax=Hymenobacter sp. 5516J-16 TaxID=2932253 RepID=UPI001FD18311|nr:hypothetical protein [Hymenobacter sp. 5516J-16]UOQ78648.1 hypothetical protein MUN84_08970 [Hymenobacter sp. 5516J-16]